MINCSTSLIFIIMIIRTYGSHTIRSTHILRSTIINDKKMPSLYINRDIHVEENLYRSLYSIEHIVPRSFLNRKDYFDMHNVIRTINELNVNRSNYKYTDEVTNDKNWIKLDFDNYVNHKKKLFIPNSTSRGFIARAILYMSKEYDYNPHKIINKEILMRWYFEYPPDKHEQYHNQVAKKLQHTNNIFISSYNKKTKQILKYLESL